MIFKPEQPPLPEIKPLPKKPKRKGAKRRGGRWAIVILFGLTALASLFFYFKTEIPKIWERVAAPMVISTLPEEERFDPSPVLEEIEKLTKDLRGTYGVYIYRFSDGNEYGLYEDKVFPAASLIKLPVILALYQQAEKGEINLESKYALVDQDKVSGAGILQGKPAGTICTYRQLAEYMGQYSDNTAFRVTRKILGDEVIEGAIKNLGMSVTSLKENKTAPEEIGLFFKKLYQGELVSGKYREEILKFLTDTGFEDRIPAGVPKDVRVAHKIGAGLGSFSDAGIVFTERPFILVIMSKAARESEAVEVLPKITEAIWGFENSRDRRKP